ERHGAFGHVEGGAVAGGVPAHQEIARGQHKAKAEIVTSHEPWGLERAYLDGISTSPFPTAAQKSRMVMPGWVAFHSVQIFAMTSDVSSSCSFLLPTREPSLFIMAQSSYPYHRALVRFSSICQVADTGWRICPRL